MTVHSFDIGPGTEPGQRDDAINLALAVGAARTAWNEAMKMEIHHHDANTRAAAGRIRRALEQARAAIDRVRYPNGFGR